MCSISVCRSIVSKKFGLTPSDEERVEHSIADSPYQFADEVLVFLAAAGVLAGIVEPRAAS